MAGNNNDPDREIYPQNYFHYFCPSSTSSCFPPRICLVKLNHHKVILLLSHSIINIIIMIASNMHDVPQEDRETTYRGRQQPNRRTMKTMFSSIHPLLQIPGLRTSRLVALGGLILLNEVGFLAGCFLRSAF